MGPDPNRLTPRRLASPSNQARTLPHLPGHAPPGHAPRSHDQPSHARVLLIGPAPPRPPTKPEPFPICPATPRPATTSPATTSPATPEFSSSARPPSPGHDRTLPPQSWTTRPATTKPLRSIRLDPPPRPSPCPIRPDLAIVVRVARWLDPGIVAAACAARSSSSGRSPVAPGRGRSGQHTRPSVRPARCCLCS
jgi:hypothetical protein